MRNKFLKLSRNTTLHQSKNNNGHSYIVLDVSKGKVRCTWHSHKDFQSDFYFKLFGYNLHRYLKLLTKRDACFFGTTRALTSSLSHVLGRPHHFPLADGSASLLIVHHSVNSKGLCGCTRNLGAGVHQGKKKEKMLGGKSI
jgi:hypothetical protein